MYGKNPYLRISGWTVTLWIHATDLLDLTAFVDGLSGNKQLLSQVNTSKSTSPYLFPKSISDKSDNHFNPESNWGMSHL